MRRSISSLIAGSLVAGTLVLAAPAAHAVNGRIAYVSGRSGPNQTGLLEVFTVSDTGAGVKNVTKAPASVDVDPSWHPTLDQIVFARQSASSETFNLLIKVPDQAGTTTLTSGSTSDRQPDWSSGGLIAFTRTIRSDGTSHVYRINEGGGGLMQLTSTAAPGYDSSPAFSPSGNQIAFVSDRAGGIPHIFTMGADGIGQTQRTVGPCFATNPSWLTETTFVYEHQCPGEDADLYTYDTGTSAPTPLITDDTSDHQPAASPDQNQVAFTRIEPDGDKDVYIWDIATMTPTPIENSDQVDMAADWGSVTARSAAVPASTGISAPRSGERARSDEGEVRAPKGKKGKKGKKKWNKRMKKKKFKVSKGVKFQRFRKAKSDAYLLKVNAAGKPTIDVALARDRLPGRERVKGMAKRHKGVAAINGDFGMPPNGRPSHTFAKDGDLKQVSFAVAWNFAMARDERSSFFDRPLERVTAVETDTWRIDRWNFGVPAFNDISAHTAAGAGAEPPPANACAVRLVPTAGPRWAPGMTGVETPYTVGAVGCATAPMPMNGGIVLAARPGSDGALLLQSLVVGEGLAITWSLGWDQVVDTIGGTPLLVENGVRVAKKCSESICKRHPRTAIGVTAAGKILMLVIDGRTKRSKGVTIVKLANIMKALGAVFALNLDGGGSSTMIVRGKVMNRPSDGKQRRVSSSVLVLKGGDKNEVIGAPQPARAAPASGGGGGDGGAALLDPASTGGLLEAMAEGTFGPVTELPARLDRALRRFRSGS